MAESQPPRLTAPPRGGGRQERAPYTERWSDDSEDQDDFQEEPPRYQSDSFPSRSRRSSQFDQASEFSGQYGGHRPTFAPGGEAIPYTGRTTTTDTNTNPFAPKSTPPISEKSYFPPRPNLRIRNPYPPIHPPPGPPPGPGPPHFYHGSPPFAGYPSTHPYPPPPQLDPYATPNQYHISPYAESPPAYSRSSRGQPQRPIDLPQIDERVETSLEQIQRQIRSVRLKQKRMEENEREQRAAAERQRNDKKIEMLERQLILLRREIDQERSSSLRSVDHGRLRPSGNLDLVEALRGSMDHRRTDDTRMLLQDFLRRLDDRDAREGSDVYSSLDRLPARINTAPLLREPSNSGSHASYGSRVEELLDLLDRINLDSSDDRDRLPLPPPSQAGLYSEPDTLPGNTRRQRVSQNWQDDEDAEPLWSPSSGTAVNTNDTRSLSESSQGRPNSIVSESRLDRSHSYRTSQSAAFRPSASSRRPTHGSDPGSQYYTANPRQAAPMHDPWRYKPRRPGPKTTQSDPPPRLNAEKPKGRAKSRHNSTRNNPQRDPGTKHDVDDGDNNSNDSDEDDDEVPEAFPPREPALYRMSGKKLHRRAYFRPDLPHAPNPPIGGDDQREPEAGQRPKTHQNRTRHPEDHSSDLEDGYFEDYEDQDIPYQASRNTEQKNRRQRRSRHSRP